MRLLFCLACLFFISTTTATFTIQMQITLNPVASTQTATLLTNVKAAVATTAGVSAGSVSVSNMVHNELIQQYIVDLNILANDYETASDVGIRLEFAYLLEDLIAQGIEFDDKLDGVDKANITNGPVFQNHNYPMLSCVSCEEGEYLDGVCRQCPDFSHTLPRVNAPDINHCVCSPGYTPETASDFYNLIVSNGRYRLSEDGEERPTLRIFRGVRTRITWPWAGGLITEPDSHPIAISNDNQWPAESTFYSVADDYSPTLGVTDVLVPTDYREEKVYYMCSNHVNMLIGEIELVDQTCSPCGIGFFKPELNNVSCTACPGNSSTAMDNATDLAECLCNPGFFRENGVCTECQPGTFKPILSDANCTTCTPNSHSPSNSITNTSCVCNLGYIGPNGGPCEACVAGKYRSGADTSICDDCKPGKYNVVVAATSADACQPCPPNTNSSSGSGSTLDCVCNPGFSSSRADSDTAWTCDPCSPGFYSTESNSSECSACGPGTYSTVSTAITAHVCTECPDGQFNVDSGKSECTLCPFSTWQNVSFAGSKARLCSSCPTSSSHAKLGSIDIHDCICEATFFKVDNLNWNFAAPVGTVSNVNMSDRFAADSDKFLAHCGSSGRWMQDENYLDNPATVDSCYRCSDTYTNNENIFLKFETIGFNGCSGSCPGCGSEPSPFLQNSPCFDATNPWIHNNVLVNNRMVLLCADNTKNYLLYYEQYLMNPYYDFVQILSWVIAECDSTFNFESELRPHCVSSNTHGIKYYNDYLVYGSPHSGSLEYIYLDRWWKFDPPSSQQHHDICYSVDITYSSAPCTPELSTPFLCEICTAGDYCSGDNIRRECDTNYYSLAGASECSECADNSQAIVSAGLISSGQCQCVLGYEGPSHISCSACGLGKFQPDDYTYDSLQTELRDGITNETMAVAVSCGNCAQDTYADTTASSVCTECVANTDTGGAEGSTDATDCACSAGYFGPDGGPCDLCPVGRFCPGGTTFQTCRLHSNSSAGASSEEDCQCNPGYFSNALGTTCQKCPPDSFCPGHLYKIGCSGNSFSPAGSSSISQCWCNGGMWRGCILTSDGESLNATGLACTINYTLPCFDCGADVICLNNTLLHCPEHSVAPPGSHDWQSCECVDGYYNVDIHTGFV